jgi:hypothetical protein
MEFRFSVQNLVAQEVKVDSIDVVVTYTVEETVEMLRQYPNIINQVTNVIKEIKNGN